MTDGGHEMVGVIVSDNSEERLVKQPQMTMIMQSERQQIKIMNEGQMESSKEQATSNSLRNLESIGRTQVISSGDQEIVDGLGFGEPIKTNEATTKIIKLQNQINNAQPGVGKLGSTDISQITSPDKTVPLVPQLTGLNHGNLDSNLPSLEQTFSREIVKRAGTDAPNTSREQDIITANALRDSISRKTNESHRDRLNTLNLDLDIPTSQFMQKQKEEKKLKKQKSGKGAEYDSKIATTPPLPQKPEIIEKRQSGAVLTPADGERRLETSNLDRPA